MRNADVPEDGTNERRGFFSRRREARGSASGATSKNNAPSVDGLEKVVSDLRAQEKLISEARDKKIESINKGIATSATSASITSYTPTTYSSTGYTSGGVIYSGSGSMSTPYITGGSYITGGGITSSGIGTTSTSPINTNTDTDKIEKMKKDHVEQIRKKDEELEEAKTQLRLAKTQLGLQIAENDELLETQMAYETLIVRLDRGITSNRNIIDLLRKSLKRISKKYE